MPASTIEVQCSAVAQAQQRSGIGEHLTDRLMVARDIGDPEE
jgi:ribosomal protein S18 acetylase RimI-like enzyme